MLEEDLWAIGDLLGQDHLALQKHKVCDLHAIVHESQPPKHPQPQNETDKQGKNPHQNTYEIKV